ncbi:hypothetical protein BD410DRAFT_792678 [Rickenella mellea]|uniref:TERF2-interacting telomeric protein 1 Myb domain-containing protein n=1 Tax=Rickenella mellea TaxID=50990 RepID=A0A4Y7PV39_9AGAM|nr:hypothetical protein BD410DRAFT_792678 [Rickenella mellea]
MARSDEELDDGAEIFVHKETGQPVKFYLHSKLLKEQVVNIRDKIKSNGGEVIEIEADADTVIVPSALLKIMKAKYSHSHDTWVEGPDFVRKCVTAKEYSHVDPIRQRMGGRHGGKDDGRLFRTEFTAEDDENLCRYLAHRIPDKESGGRTGNKVYQQLVEHNDAWGEEHRYPWAARHTWHSWRERYKKNLARFDVRIQKIVAKNPPPPNGKGLYPLTRKMIPVGAMESEESEEEGDDEEAPDDAEYVPGANKQAGPSQASGSKKRRGESDDEASPPAKRRPQPRRAVPRRVDDTSIPAQVRQAGEQQTDNHGDEDVGQGDVDDGFMPHRDEIVVDDPEPTVNPAPMNTQATLVGSQPGPSQIPSSSPVRPPPAKSPAARKTAEMVYLEPATSSKHTSQSRQKASTVGFETAGDSIVITNRKVSAPTSKGSDGPSDPKKSGTVGSTQGGPRSTDRPRDATTEEARKQVPEQLHGRQPQITSNKPAQKRAAEVQPTPGPSQPRASILTSVAGTRSQSGQSKQLAVVLPPPSPPKGTRAARNPARSVAHGPPTTSAPAPAPAPTPMRMTRARSRSAEPQSQPVPSAERAKNKGKARARELTPVDEGVEESSQSPEQEGTPGEESFHDELSVEGVLGLEESSADVDDASPDKPQDPADSPKDADDAEGDESSDESENDDEASEDPFTAQAQKMVFQVAPGRRASARPSSPSSVAYGGKGSPRSSVMVSNRKGKNPLQKNLANQLGGTDVEESSDSSERFPTPNTRARKVKDVRILEMKKQPFTPVPGTRAAAVASTRRLRGSQR